MRVSLLEKQEKDYSNRIQEMEERKKLLLRAQSVIDQTISKVSEGGITKMEKIITDGLRLTFPDKDLKFIIDKKTGARGNTYQFLLKEGDTVAPVMDSFGGGVINVIQLLMRVILIQRFGLRRLLALDEPFNNLSVEYRSRVSDLMRSICEDQGFDILMVTHMSEFAHAANRVYKVSKGPQMRLLEDYELDELRMVNDEERRGSGSEAQGPDPQSPKEMVQEE